MTMPESGDLLVVLSTSSVYPDSTENGFERARRLGYDGVEVMVGIDETSTDAEAVVGFSQRHEMPVRSIHAPCLLITQRIWGDAWEKLRRSADMAHTVGAGVVVVHPPFRWQRNYAAEFVEGIAALEAELDMVFAVENMYPWGPPGRAFQAYAPGHNPVDHDYDHVTVDLSHASTAHDDPVQMLFDLGPRLAHVHMADGSGSVKDEHRVPGRGGEPCEEFLAALAASDYSGDIVIEVNTRRAGSDRQRDVDLLESLAFTRLHARRQD